MSGRLLKWPVALGRLRDLRGMIAAPGAISLSGLLIAAATVSFDHAFPDLAARGFAPEAARAVLTTLAGAAMTALGLVYSITLVVFTLAASAIAPRLLERFAKDPVNQVAIGALGALFLHALASLLFAPEGPSFAPVGAAAGMALLSILLLLVFIDRVAKRITVDEEIAAIADALDESVVATTRRASGLDRETVVLPIEPEAPIRAPVSGYLSIPSSSALTRAARKHGGVVDLVRAPGDHCLKGELIGRALGGEANDLAREAEDALYFARRRNEDGDLRFSVSLLLEIAIRALSPGVNDSFTAIAVIERLSASLDAAAAQGLNPGVYCDDDGAARVVVPKTGLDELIRTAFGPIRRNARNNILVAEAAYRALHRLAPRITQAAREEAERQAELILAEIEAGAALPADLDRLREEAKHGSSG